MIAYKYRKNQASVLWGTAKTKPYKTSKAPDGQGPLLTNYKPKL